MSETVEALLCDMLAWLARDARPYGEVMDAWRTSCPRLPVWEDANERGFVEQVRAEQGAVVRITPAGREFLRRRSAATLDLVAACEHSANWSAEH